MDVEYRVGFNPRDAKLVSLLYNESFGQKFTLAIPDNEKRRELVEKLLNPQFCICAYTEDHLVGVAGFQDSKGALVRKADIKTLVKTLGTIGGLWAAINLFFYQRQSYPNELLLDGVANDPQCRGQGIGKGLLLQVIAYAQQNKYVQVRLDVPDMSEKARSLYMKFGFKVHSQSRFPMLRQLLFLHSHTRLILDLDT